MRANGTITYLHSDHWATLTTVYTTAAPLLRNRAILLTDQRFTGQKHDGTGLLYYNARYGW